MERNDLLPIVEAAVRHFGGRASVVQVASYIWEHHEAELRASGNLFYTWQYDMRWAALKLRKARKLIATELTDRGYWQIA
jgi:hypothetical protein